MISCGDNVDRIWRLDGEKPFREAHRTDVHRRRKLEFGATHDELGAPAADIDDERRHLGRDP